MVIQWSFKSKATDNSMFDILKKMETSQIAEIEWNNWNLAYFENPLDPKGGKNCHSSMLNC